MASSLVPVEDQTDEDFFDKLVEDEGEGGGSAHNLIEHALSDKNVESDNISSVEGSHAGVISCSSNVESPGANQSGTPESSKSGGSGSIIVYSDQDTGGAGAFDLKVSKGGKNAGQGVKEVQWSAFNSDSHFNAAAGDASHSEFFNDIGDNSADLFGEVSGCSMVEPDNTVGVSSIGADSSSSYGYLLHDQNPKQGLSAECTAAVQDISNSQYWENLYPGWRYDPNTGQWYQLESSDAVGSTGEAHSGNVESTVEGVISGQQSDMYYLQQTAQSVTEGVTDGGTTGNVSYRNHTSEGSVEYPAHMLFDPQYPGWYYDTVAQEWRSLESYTTSTGGHLASSDHSQQTQNGYASASTYYSEQRYIGHGQGGQVHNYHQLQDQVVNWDGSMNKYNDPNVKGWEPQPLAKNETVNFTENMQSCNGYVSIGQVNNSTAYRAGVTVPSTTTLYEPSSQVVERNNGFIGFQSFGPADSILQHDNQHNMEMNHQMQFSPANFNGPKPLNISQTPLQSSSLLPCAPSEGRSSAGRPPHALVTFGFGGKLIVMKDQDPLSYGSQDSAGGVIDVLNIMEVAVPTNDALDTGLGACGYFHALCQQSFPGPLVSGNVGIKELNKWIDNRLANCETLYRDYERVHISRMLFSLLKITCQYYGKLRSPFGTDNVLKESDCPESALAELFVSAKRSSMQFNQPNSLTQCLQNLPSEGQIQATALEVQKLLVSGRRMEALQCAQEGQLWGPAIVIAAQLGDQFYSDTVKQMAFHQLTAGCPLRTLCLLIAGQPAEVFSSSTSSNQAGALNGSQPAQIGANCMLDEWEENLAIITSNRTKGDELVITHLGDCLWKEKGEVTAAHICYLVAEANIEPYSDSARLCLIGADHWKYPRTYASPEAIQRTEVYEYAKVLGNSQFILMPFQPYKLLYAYMLAEVGKLSDSWKYCQAILRSLKTGRAPEVDAWKHLVSCLEDRIKIHQQGGYAANLAPAKLVGKLLNFFDSTAHRVVGGPPPPSSSVLHSNSQQSEHDHQLRGTRVSTSQSTMAMSSLVSSASFEPINEWTSGSNRKALHNRSISEPDIGRIPRKVDSPEQSSTTNSQDNSTVLSSSSRFGRIGSQLFQKTFGLVLKSRTDRQAKLGDKNRFYYDEKLKRWVEEGSEPPAEEAALPLPPTAAAFVNGVPNHSMKDESGNSNLRVNGEPEFRSANSAEKSSGMPPIPPGSNQFSARGRGVRARYVDTFNKGGGAPVTLFHSPSAPTTKATGVSAKFFIPTPLPAGEDASLGPAENTHQAGGPGESSLESVKSDVSSQMPKPSVPLERYPSMDSMVNKSIAVIANGNGALPPHSRRTASWGGSLGSAVDFAKVPETKPLGEALGFPPSTYTANDHSAMQFPASGAMAGEDLQEVEL